MAERLLLAQPISVANRIKARQSLIERAVTWLATESGLVRSKRSAICSGKLCEGTIIFGHSRRQSYYADIKLVNTANLRGTIVSGVHLHPLTPSPAAQTQMYLGYLLTYLLTYYILQRVCDTSVFVVWRPTRDGRRPTASWSSVGVVAA